MIKPQNGQNLQAEWILGKMATTRTRATIGVLITNPVSEFNCQIVDGVNHYAKKHDINTVILSGGFLEADPLLGCFNSIYDLFGHTSFDGLVLPSGSLSRNVDSKTFITFLKRFGDIPIVTIGKKFEGYTNISSDIATGVENLINHAIEVHQCANIVIVYGSKGHLASLKRLNGYKRALETHNIPFRDDFLVETNLRPQDSRNIVEAIEAIVEKLSHEHQKIDAIAAFNDKIGEEIQKILSNHPALSETLIFGMQNKEGSLLTTSDEKNFTLGLRAAEIVHDKIFGTEDEKSHHELEIVPELVIKKSCKCAINTIEHETDINVLLNLIKNDLMKKDNVETEGTQGTIAKIDRIAAIVKKRDQFNAGSIDDILYKLRNFNYWIPQDLSYGIKELCKDFGIRYMLVLTKNNEFVELAAQFHEEKVLSINEEEFKKDICTLEIDRIINFAQRHTTAMVSLEVENTTFGYLLLEYPLRNPGIMINLSTMISQVESLLKSSMTDSLTGLPNRACLDMKLQMMTEKARQENTKCGVFIIDVDEFKLINDTLGHSEGDAVLKVITELILLGLRKDDLLCRTGGDEFTVIIPDIDGKDTLKIIGNRVVDSVFNQKHHLKDSSGKLSISVGGAIFPDDSEDLNELLKIADSAMYIAKEQGKGQAVVY